MGARIICVGDQFQAIYAFRGADCNAFGRIREMLQKSNLGMIAKELPINYRCDQRIIEHARRWVPNLQGASRALGTDDSITFEKAIQRANNDGVDIALPDGPAGQMRTLPLPGKSVSFAFLCRINLPLVITAYQLIAQRKRCCIIGRNQIGLPLKNIINSICGTNPKDPGYTNRISDRTDSDGDVIEEGLLTRLNHYSKIQSGKLKGEGNEKKLETLQQNVECIEVIAANVMDDCVSTLLSEIDTLFVEDQEPGVISLSTVHRAKGLEWDVVFILRPDLMPHPLAKPNPDGSWSDDQQQEQNCQYIARTRARNRIYDVLDWPFGNNRKSLHFDHPQPGDANSSPSPVSIEKTNLVKFVDEIRTKIFSDPANTTPDLANSENGEFGEGKNPEKPSDDGLPF